MGLEVLDDGHLREDQLGQVNRRVLRRPPLAALLRLIIVFECPHCRWEEAADVLGGQRQPVVWVGVDRQLPEGLASYAADRFLPPHSSKDDGGWSSVSLTSTTSPGMVSPPHLHPWTPLTVRNAVISPSARLFEDWIQSANTPFSATMSPVRPVVKRKGSGSPTDRLLALTSALSARTESPSINTELPNRELPTCKSRWA
mmetsp:Transcript_6681/g.19387  ORF Transcript_6681/g.19387 Transcript_6681/m.19387 type:complete len:200 (+) Transcript_6681:752-1351(+)